MNGSKRISMNIGRRRTLIVALIGMFIVYLLFGLISGSALWIVHTGFTWAIVIGLIAYGCMIYLVGGILGYVVREKNWYSIPITVPATFLIVSCSIAAGCTFRYYTQQNHTCYLPVFIWHVLRIFLLFGWWVMIFLGVCLGLWLRSQNTERSKD